MLQVMEKENCLYTNKLIMSEKKEDKPADNKENQDMIESYEPRFALEQVALNEKVKEQIQTAIAAVRYKSKMTEEWGMSEYFSGNRAVILNFYGKAGTGKSMTAEAVAKALDKKVYHINYSELESKYVGETPKNIRRAFECATRDDAVLIFDEADSFLGKRLSSVTQSADYGVNITRSVLLMELEKFSGVVVFTALALVLDIKLTIGIASATLAILGFNNQAIVRIDASEGEKCLILEAIQSKNRVIDEDIFSICNHQCVHNDLNCKYQDGDSCTINKENINAILDGLCDKNIFKKIHKFYKYNF